VSEQDPSLAEQVELLSQWESGTYPSPESSARDHYARHREDFDPIPTLWEYLRKAQGFDKNTARRVPSLGTRTDGTVRFISKSGEFLIERNGKIVSFGCNRSQ
jgi:hypothetical protein